MDTIRVPVQALKLGLFPQTLSPSPPSASGGQRLDSLARGLAIPSFWDNQQITAAFQGANRTWAQAAIEFGPVTIMSRTVSVPADDNAMWIAFVNQLSPSRGITAAFVYDLPSDEGGWGGGRIAIIAGKKAEGAIEGYRGRILAHELGHVLLGDSHEPVSSNLMFDRRHPRVVSADLLEPDQIQRARTRAQTL